MKLEPHLKHRERDWFASIELDWTYAVQYSADFPPDKLETVARELWGDEPEKDGPQHEH
jgi:hypothetical protein